MMDRGLREWGGVGCRGWRENLGATGRPLQVATTADKENLLRQPPGAGAEKKNRCSEYRHGFALRGMYGAMGAVGEGRRLLCGESRKSVDDGNHRTPNPPTLLLQTAGDENSDPEAAADEQTGLGNAESMSARVAGLGAALGD